MVSKCLNLHEIRSFGYYFFFPMPFLSAFMVQWAVHSNGTWDAPEWAGPWWGFQQQMWDPSPATAIQKLFVPGAGAENLQHFHWSPSEPSSTGSPRSTTVCTWREGGLWGPFLVSLLPKIKFSMKPGSCFPLLFPSPQLTSHLSLAASSFLDKTCFSFLLKAKTSCQEEKRKGWGKPTLENPFPMASYGAVPPSPGSPQPTPGACGVNFPALFGWAARSAAATALCLPLKRIPVNWRGWFVWSPGFCWACCGFFFFFFLPDWLADIYFQGDHWQGENTQFTQPRWNTEAFASNRKKINTTWNACMCQKHSTWRVEKTSLWICSIYCSARATPIKYVITRQAQVN